MSGVLVRHRKLSELEFYKTAFALRVEVNRVAMDEDVFPKRYRFSNAMPIIEEARDVVRNIARSDKFYPNTPFNVRERRRYATLAIASCQAMMDDLRCYIETRRDRVTGNIPFEIGRLENLIAMADEEIALLTGYRKRVRLLGTPCIEDRIAEARAQVAALEDERAERALAGDVQ
jgi:hypothetical protein